MFSVIEKSSGRWLGRIGPWRPGRLAGNGGRLGPASVAAWGKGYAVEAAVATIDWAFDHLGWTEVIHCIDPENTPSQKVAEKLGSSNRGRGQLPAPFQDHVIDIWGQTRAEWRARAR
jgi:RimJ/RimL family protein N-acetyltransferase